MKLSLNWLSDFVAFKEKDPQKIAEELTLGVAEVKCVEIQGELLEQCVIGRVLSVQKHPNADMLFLCDVETDRGKRRVVCGGTNLREGMLVAFAHVGACVQWHGKAVQELKKATIRGEESEGMIASAEELGLEGVFPQAVGREIIDLGGEGSGIRFQVSGKQVVGAPLQEALGLDDVIFHIDNNAITHRPDLFSHIGFARECVALGLAKWKKSSQLTAHSSQLIKFPKTPLPFRCINDIRHLVPRYCACLLAIEGLGETPSWMARRLEAVGYRSLNLPIDITNYVAAEVGMPLHSFDVDDIHGDVHFRLSRKGETITTLDGVERALPDGAIVLSDRAGIFDLLGVMGGLRSSTKETTRSIYLHAAVVDPVSVRRTVTAMNHRTEASTVYEKGVPRNAAEQGLYRALALFLELVPGARILSRLESYGDNGKAKPILFSLERASSLLGRPVSVQEAKRALHALEFVVHHPFVTPPLHRLGDIREEADLVEEIARVTGFETYEATLPLVSLAVPPQDDRLHRLRCGLEKMRFTELVRFAFLGAPLLEKGGMGSERLREVANPLGEDLRYMRPSLRPHLLAFAGENLGLSQGSDLRVFEVGRVFKPQGEALHLTLLVAATREAGLKDEPFLLCKEAVTTLLSAIGLPLAWGETRGRCGSYVHPVRRLELFSQGEAAGAVYEVHPAICRNFDLPHRVAVATLDLTALLAKPGVQKVHQDAPPFPVISYDVTVPVAKGVKTATLLSRVRGTHALLRSVQLADAYAKGPERRLTFRCTYGAPDRTLTEEEVKPIHSQIEKVLQQS